MKGKLIYIPKSDVIQSHLDLKPSENFSTDYSSYETSRIGQTEVRKNVVEKQKNVKQSIDFYNPLRES